MKKGIIIAIIIIVIAALGAFFYFTRPPAAPSGNVAAVAEPLLPVQNGTGTASTTPSGTAGTYRINQAKSLASFSLHEVLSGNLNLVVGTTSQIAGDIEIDQNNPSASRIGTITIDARTLMTDNGERNGAIAHLILKTDSPANEYITFTPGTLTRLPSSIAIGQSFPFTVSGDLTISGVTQSSTWHGTATLTASDELAATASTTVQRSAFGLAIPNIPFVANVDQTVNLSATIVADEVSH